MRRKNNIELARTSSGRARPRGRAARGGCPNEAAIRQAVAELLDVPLPDAVCRLVGPAEMKIALDEHDWPANTDPNTFYGFHTDDHQILVAKKADWSVLHEVTHDGRVDDRDVARWLCEGLTEEVSEHLHRTHGFAWQPTYQGQRAVIHREILPRLRLGKNGGVKLARLVAQGGQGRRRPDRVIARAMARGHLRGRRRAIQAALNTQAGDNMNLFLEAIA